MTEISRAWCADVFREFGAAAKITRFWQQRPPQKYNSLYAMSQIEFKQVGYRYGGALELLTSTVDTAKLEPSEILVKVSAAAINPVDLILFNSHKFLTFFSKSTPKGIGRDFSGVVEAVGSDVTKFLAGDKISGLFEDTYKAYGTISQYLVIDTVRNVNIGTIPQNLTLEQAAAFPLVFGTAYTALKAFKSPKECESVLVIGGATAVGSFAIQLLKKVHKVKNVISVSSSDSSERVKKYGADIIVDYKKKNVKSTVLALTSDIGKLDAIVDCVGSSDFFDCMDEILKPKSEGSGYVSINGSTVGDYTQTVAQYLSWANIKLIFWPKTWAFKWTSIESGTWYEYAKGLFETGLLEVPIDSVHDLVNYEDAFKTLVDHKAQGKIVIKVN